MITALQQPITRYKTFINLFGHLIHYFNVTVDDNIVNLIEMLNVIGHGICINLAKLLKKLLQK